MEKKLKLNSITNTFNSIQLNWLFKAIIFSTNKLPQILVCGYKKSDANLKCFKPNIQKK